MDPQPAAEPLTFERAEFEAQPAEVTCALCGQRVVREYFRCNAQPLCAECAAQLKSQGLPQVPAAFARALGLGVLAAIAGAGVWYGIRAATGYEIGLVGIAVGWFVGVAVRRGSGARGGWLYQTLAIALVYVAIASTYVPYVLAGFAKDASPEMATGLGRAILIVFAIAYSLIVPFLLPFEDPEFLIGVLILGFAVYEAWKMNKRPELVVEGPLPLTLPTPPALAPVTAASVAVTDVPNA